MKKKVHSLIELPVVNKRGFTLVELLIVISIIGILSTIVYINWSNAQLKARDNKRKADLQAVSSALVLYYADNKYFIAKPSSGGTPVSGQRIGFNVSELTLLETKNYISDLPEDPLNQIGAEKACKYLYLQNNDDGIKPQQYKLLSTSAESLGTNSNQCKTTAGEFANNQRPCKTLQVSSSSESKIWEYSNAKDESDVKGCANYPGVK